MKATLVIDTPQSCVLCPIGRGNPCGDGQYCGVAKQVFKEAYSKQNERAPFCPLELDTYDTPKNLPVKQYQTVYYILDGRVYVGWYLAQVGDTTHLILQDKIEMGICWVSDGTWFLTEDDANIALKRMVKNNEL